MVGNIEKTALITGAACGIGFEFALLLAKKGFHLILIDKDAVKLKIVQKYILKSYRIEIILLSRDLSRPNVAEEILRIVANRPIDILINNAGFGLFGQFSKTSWKREYEMLHLHILTTTHLTKLILPKMLARTQGKILNVASVAAFLPGPFMALYYASKAYILSFSQAVASEISGTGVSLTVLCPGQTKTEFQSKVSKNSSKAKINFNLSCPKQVAQYGYKEMLKGTPVAIPGKLNKLTTFLTRMIPRKTGTFVMKKLQEKNRKNVVV